MNLIKTGLPKILLPGFIVLLCLIPMGCGGGDDDSGPTRAEWTPPENWEQEIQPAFQFAYDPGLWAMESSTETGAGTTDVSYFYNFN